MPAGLSSAGVAQLWLGSIQGSGAVASTARTSVFGQLHIGDPGSAGTGNPAATSTRVAFNFSVSGGTMTITGGSPVFTATAAETISYISFWTASSSGTFLWSAQLTVSKVVAVSDTLTFTSAGIALTPLAA